MLPVRILHIAIACPFAKAYAFAHRPQTFPRWAAGLSSSLHHTDRGWIAQAPQGEVRVEFSPPNEFGVLDHVVHLPDGAIVHIPLRMIANGDGVEVELVLFRQPAMSDQDFETDAATVTKDLAALKALLETL